MPSNTILTVRLTEEDISGLDALATLQQRSRSHIVQQAIREKLESSEELRARTFALEKAKLAPAIAEQCELLSHHSVADEHRRF